MFLDRIDIDTHGPLHRVEIGPLTEELNTILAPEGAGKTAIVRFIRDSLIHRDYPLGMMNSSTGRVVWADRFGFVHCRREQDGSAQGRRTIEFESRGEYPIRFDRLNESWIDGAADSTDASLSLQSIRLPETIVDGVITDTAITSVARVVHACLQAGLDSGEPKTFAPPKGSGESEPSTQERGQHRALLAELAEIDSELATLPETREDIDTLEVRRGVLQERLRREGEGSAADAGSGLYRTRDTRPSWIDREAIAAELHRIDETLVVDAHRRKLVRRRVELQQALANDRQKARYQSPLSQVASRWLTRLSAGELTQVDWNVRRANVTGNRRAESEAQLRQLLEIRVDGRGETELAAADRALAVIAVRLAAGELLARSGKTVPLVFETQRELLRDTYRPVAEEEMGANGNAGELESCHPTQRCQGIHPISATLRQYARAGRQIVVLTSSEAMAEELAESGGRTFRLHGSEVVHPHRPLWKAHYQAEQYVGPHPHTYGNGAMQSPNLSCDEINRDFDAAWREAYGMSNSDVTLRFASAAQERPKERSAESALDHPDLRDGFYFADRYTTQPQGDIDSRWLRGEASSTVDTNHGLVRAPGCQPENQAPSTDRGDINPFFLTVDSPIDQAPSIDAVVAARLRGLGITHITHLMQQDANRLADTLGIANVNAAAIRRWKDECRLVCRVPQLRGFDARLLVGCGITDPAQLAAMHPADLLERVQAFLATERGQRILLSGTSYELARITSWIASAHRGDRHSRDRSGMTSKSSPRRPGQHEEPAFMRDSYDNRFDVAATDDQLDEPHEAEEPLQDRVGLKLHPRRDGHGKSGRGKSHHRSRRTIRAASEAHDHNVSNSQTSDRGRTGQKASPNARADRSARDGGGVNEQRFYLEPASDVEAAPEIGPRMAERLADIGISTVDDLLQAEPESVADELDHRRVDAETVERWQQQSMLVCRVPMLRGHDAQLLVAAQITTPEELAEYDPESLLAEIEPIARSNEGKRILRGSDPPDLAEVEDWLRYAAQHRPLRAA